MIKQEKKQISSQNEELVKLEKELLDLRLAKCTGQVKDHSKFRKIRSAIANLKRLMSL